MRANWLKRRDCGSTTTALRFALMLPIAASCLANAAHAQQAGYDIDIAKGPLNQAILTLSAQTGASFGYVSPLPPTQVRAMRGRMSVASALSELLRGTGLRAVPAGPGVFRIVPAARPLAARRTLPTEAAPPEIIVTGRKRTEALADVGAPLNVYVPGTEPARDHAGDGTQQVASGIPSLTTTTAGEGADRIFIRGIADSPFLGFSQSTVAVEVDDSRVAYDGPDPGLRLVDIDRVEVLEGPQGPLYGTGALGGVYRVVPRKPVLGDTEATIGGSPLGLASGGFGGNGEAIINLPLVSDNLAVRAVGYVAERPGWVSDIGLRSRANAAHIRGQRVTLRIAAGHGWTIDLGEIGQTTRVDDSRYVDRETEQLARHVAFPEPHTGDFNLASVHVQGALGSIDVDATTSMSWHVLHSRYDASAAAVSFGVGTPAAYDETRRYRVFDQELRLSGSAAPGLSWLAGASYLTADSAAAGRITAPAQTVSTVLRLRRVTTEAALFGESVYAFGRFRAALGARLFSNNAGDELVETDQLRRAQLTFLGVSPSVSLSWRSSSGALVYARYASAVRPGGLTPGAGGRYDADTLDNVDLGTRLKLVDNRLTANLSLFRSVWKDVQSDYLLPDGLIASHNVGDADIYGGEWSVAWTPTSAWRIETSGIIERARLVRAINGAELPDDTRLPVVPDVAANLAISRMFAVGGWSATAKVDARYTGPTRLSFDTGLDRRTPEHAEIALRGSASRGAFTLRMGIDNLANSGADTFGFGNPFSVAAKRQFTPLQPRTFWVGGTIRR